MYISSSLYTTELLYPLLDLNQPENLQSTSYLIIRLRMSRTYNTSYWCDTLTYVMKLTIVISDERYGFVCLLFKFYTENVSVYLLFLFVFVSVFWHCEILSIALFLVYIFLNSTYIGVDFALKVINWDPDTLIRLQLWDIAGNTYSIADNILYLMSRKRCWLTRTNMFLSTRIYNLFHANSGCIPWGWSG